MEEERINKYMKKLEEKIHYHFNNISNLSAAMYSKKISIEGSEYSNDGLATVGDAILKWIITDKLFSDGIKTKGEITDKRSKIENNKSMHQMMIQEGLIDYAYNENHFHKDKDIPEHEKVIDKGHDPYIEAIVAAVYYDSDYDTTKNWILNWLLPTIEKYRAK